MSGGQKARFVATLVAVGVLALLVGMAASGGVEWTP